ncbi:hypothetical protein EWM58_09250 [Candidatus Erwinia dacicola]|nr:hypothetical protein [Candidatus Erwinia dacicola]
MLLLQLNSGISLPLPDLCNSALASGQLVALLPQYQLEDLGMYAIYSSRQHQPPRLRALQDFLSKWFHAERAQR